MKKILCLLTSFILLISSTGISVVYADSESDGELIVNETFDYGTETWKDFLTMSNYSWDWNKNNNDGRLQIGDSYNQISTVDSYDNYVIQFDYCPGYCGNPRFVFNIGGYEFHMYGMDTGVEDPMGVSSGATITKENSFTFPNQTWSTIKVEKVGKEFWLYAKATNSNSFMLVYKGTFNENRIAPFVFDVAGTSSYGTMAYMDNLKIWDLSFSGSIEEKLYDINPNSITVVFKDELAQNIPENVAISGGAVNAQFPIAKIDNKTVEISIPDGVLDYNTEYVVNLGTVMSSRGIASKNVSFKTLVKIIANIDGEQVAREGTEISIGLSPDGSLPDGSLIMAQVLQSIDISNNGTIISCPARAEGDKIIITLPEQLQFSTVYQVDMSTVQAMYNVKGIDYYLSLDDITFLTNNGEKELALDAVNSANTADVMVTTLEAFNNFNDVSACIDFFTDAYFTNVSGNAQKLLARKQNLAQKLIGYRQENGNFTKMDFSEIIEGIQSCLFELKIESYTIPDEAVEDMLGIFVDTQIYDSNEKKIQSVGLITELMDGEICGSVDELIALEKKAKSVMSVSLVDNADIITVFDDTNNFDFNDIVDLSNEDYTNNKLVVAAKMTELRADNFGYYSVSSLKSDFYLATALTAINVADTRIDMATAIDKYGESIGLDLSQYNNFDSNLVCAALVNKLFNSVGEIQTAINQRISVLNSTSTNTGSTQGGSRPSGGGTSVMVAPAAPVSVVRPDNSNEHRNPFMDIDSVEWAKEAIISLYNDGKVNGVSEGVFEPNRSITRAEFSKLLSEIFEIPKKDTVSFIDVKENDWYYSSVSAVSSAGIVYGNYNNEFMPQASLTRQDMAVMIYRLLVNQNKDSIFSKDRSEEEFYDFFDVSDYAKEAVNKLYANGIVNGTGNNKFSPLSNTTRAEAAVILYRVRNSLGGKMHE